MAIERAKFWLKRPSSSVKMKAKMLDMIAAHIVSYDVWFYVSHLALHRPSLYWIHKRHHENRFPTWRDTYHESGWEGVFQSLGFLVPWVFSEFDWKASLAAGLLLNVRGLMHHDPRMSWLVGSHHLKHHEFFDGNYGQPWLDALFGTALPAHLNTT